MAIFEDHKFHYVHSAYIKNGRIHIQYCNKDLEKTYKQEISKPLDYRGKRFSSIEESFDLLIAAINEDWRIYINSVSRVLTKTDMLDVKRWQDE